MRTGPILCAVALVASALIGPGAPGAGASAALPPPGPSAACAASSFPPAPLLVALHGYGSSPERLLAASGLRGAARRAGVVVVAPRGRGADPHWSTPGGLRAGGDAATVADAVRAAASRQCVDLSRITLVGYSNGALMATWLACEWRSRVTAVVLVNGANLGPACAPPHVRALVVHGSADDVVPIRGGPVLDGRLRATAFAPTVAARWPAARVVIIRGGEHVWPSRAAAGLDIATHAVTLATHP